MVWGAWPGLQGRGGIVVAPCLLSGKAHFVPRAAQGQPARHRCEHHEDAHDDPKPCSLSASGIPPTFMPSKPARMLMGSASTVTTVSTNRLRLLASCTLAASSSCSSLMRSLQALHVAQHHRELFGGIAQLLHIVGAHPGGWVLQQAEQGCRLGASSRCSRTSNRRSTPSQACLWLSRPASNSSSMPSMRW